MVMLGDYLVATMTNRELARYFMQHSDAKQVKRWLQHRPTLRWEVVHQYHVNLPKAEAIVDEIRLLSNREYDGKGH